MRPAAIRMSQIHPLPETAVIKVILSEKAGDPITGIQGCSLHYWYPRRANYLQVFMSGPFWTRSRR
jgi:hypothetical protein